MSNDNAAGVAAWLESHADIALPSDRLPSYVQTTASVCASVAAQTAGLAMEDEPACFVAALARHAPVKR